MSAHAELGKTLKLPARMLRLAAMTACSAAAPGTVLAQTSSLLPPSAAAERVMPAGDWWTINRDAAATRYSPLREINVENVSRLSEAWSYTLDASSTAVPLVAGGVMYLPNGNRVVAIEGDTGAEIWSFELQAPAASAPRRESGLSIRGLGYWPGSSEQAARVLFMSGRKLHAVEAATGEPSDDFGSGGFVDIGVPYEGTPTIYRNVAIVGAAVEEVPRGAAGNPRAFDVVTGEKLWEFQTVPRPGEPFNETWGDGWERRSGANMWAFAATVDAQRGLVYLPISGPAANYYGGDRPGSNVFANSIVALDAETGDYRWHFQTVHHDLWDVDMPSAGGLFDFVAAGRRTPAIAHVGKSSYLFVLDRVTGEPLIDVEERPVPRGDVPGEWYAPTQPFPVKPRPLSRVSFDAARDLVRAEDTSAEHAAACREVMERSGGYYNEGPFTPFLYKAADEPPKSTIQLPGGTGGVNWGGAAVDPATGYVYVNAHDTSLVGWIEDRQPGKNYGRGTAESDQAYDRASISGAGPYASFNAPLNGEFDEDGRAVGPSLPCYRPPWARLVAVDASRGEIVWESVLGINESLPAGKQVVGGTGSAGPTITAGGLVFIGATNDQRFRAFDARSGNELWTVRLESPANANPMTYLGADGEQRIAIVAGDRVKVYALPAGAPGSDDPAP